MCDLTLSSSSNCFRRLSIVMFFGWGKSFLWIVNSSFTFVMLFILFSIYFLLFSYMMLSCKYMYMSVITSLGRLVSFETLESCVCP